MHNMEFIISPTKTILFAMKQMDEIKRKLLIILDKNKFIGVLSIGDIQRAIINQWSMDTPILEIKRSVITVANADDSIDSIREQMLNLRTEFMPVVDKHMNLINVITWEEIMQNSSEKSLEKLKIPVVIMAGGEGTRLKPLTNVIPKSLIPIGRKTILEEIMDSFENYGCSIFYLSVNYKAEIIKYYLDNQSEIKYNISYIQEDKPLGTAGSLHLLNNAIQETFFVTNCDIIIDQDYSEILKYHKENNNELTVVAALKSYFIPYGTIETTSNGVLEKIIEKPEITFKINTGFYILEPHLISEIPQNTFYHITTLIEKLQMENRRVGVFPISENSWKDIGEWDEYLKLIQV